MEWEHVESHWSELKTRAREKWGKLSESDLEQIAGRRDALCGRLQQLYGRREGEIEADLREWQQALDEIWQQADDAPI